MQRIRKPMLYALFFGVSYILARQDEILRILTQELNLPTKISISSNFLISILVAAALYVLYASDVIVLRGVLKRLVRAVYSAIYRNQLDPEPSEERIYRVTCYQYCESWWQRVYGVTRVVGRAILKWRWQRVADAIRRGRKGAFLFCVERYGWENDKIVQDRTTLVLRAVPREGFGELFAGKVFVSPSRFLSSETKIVNSIISKIVASTKELPKAESFESIEDSIQKLEGKVSEFVSEEEWKNLKSFMQNTNTGLEHLFAINPRMTKNGPAGCHCNHFIGFKIYKDSQQWGVVTIDALDSRERFAEVIDRDAIRAVSLEGDPQVKRNPDDFKALLGALSNTFSSVISKGSD